MLPAKRIQAEGDECTEIVSHPAESGEHRANKGVMPPLKINNRKGVVLADKETDDMGNDKGTEFILSDHEVAEAVASRRRYLRRKMGPEEILAAKEMFEKVRTKLRSPKTKCERLGSTGKGEVNCECLHGAFCNKTFSQSLLFLERLVHLKKVLRKDPTARTTEMQFFSEFRTIKRRKKHDRKLNTNPPIIFCDNGLKFLLGVQEYHEFWQKYLKGGKGGKEENRECLILKKQFTKDLFCVIVEYLESRGSVELNLNHLPIQQLFSMYCQHHPGEMAFLTFKRKCGKIRHEFKALFEELATSRDQGAAAFRIASSSLHKDGILLKLMNLSCTGSLKAPPHQSDVHVIHVDEPIAFELLKQEFNQLRQVCGEHVNVTNTMELSVAPAGTGIVQLNTEQLFLKKGCDDIYTVFPRIQTDPSIIRFAGTIEKAVRRAAQVPQTYTVKHKFTMVGNHVHNLMNIDCEYSDRRNLDRDNILAVQMPHLDVDPLEIIKLRNSNCKMMLVLGPLSPDGMWLRTWPTFQEQFMDSRGGMEKYPTKFREGEMWFIPYKSAVIIPITLLHASGIRTSLNDNYQYQFIFMFGPGDTCNMPPIVNWVLNDPINCKHFENTGFKPVPVHIQARGGKPTLDIEPAVDKNNGLWYCGILRTIHKLFMI